MLDSQLRGAAEPAAGVTLAGPCPEDLGLGAAGDQACRVGVFPSRPEHRAEGETPAPSVAHPGGRLCHLPTKSQPQWPYSLGRTGLLQL